ncbi:hypothetical protein [Streptacidiphilus sp. EB103A]|uniref:hypothetical protein n=1 Tax=Streptacidiphilus sp. EB103A TaxID=3156275 RepID=UPI003518495A
MTEQATTPALTEIGLSACPGSESCAIQDSHVHRLYDGSPVFASGWLIDLTAGYVAVELVPARVRRPKRRKRRR